MKSLTSNVVPIKSLSAETIAAMYDLYTNYYDGTNKVIFEKDLAKKTWVILLFDQEHQLKGFSTLALFNNHYENQPQRILYSGDTIVDQQFWGQHELANTWLRIAGEVKAENPTIPLYWLLIVKGHRTYRYLSAFCHNYYPAHHQPIPQPIQGLMDQLAHEHFGNAYDRTRGIISFPETRGYLRDTWSVIPEKVKKRADVQYFLKRNPNYTRGDELVCLCELTETNLKPFAKRIFNL